MRPLKALAAAAALAAAPMAIATPAHAQAGAAIVIDFQTIMEQSTAGRDMRTKLEAIQTQMRNEIAPEEQAIQTEIQAINQATQGQTPEAVRANSQLTQRINALQTRRQALAQRAQGLDRDYQYTATQALVEYNRQLTPIVQQVMQQRGASITLDRSNVLLRVDGVDATQDVLNLLNQRVTTVAVTRQAAPPPPQPPQQ